MKSLKGKRVLITGAARGIGAETARQLAKKGARLALVGLEPELLRALAEALGPEHCWAECDVTDYPSLEAAVERSVAGLSGLDVVMANAGIANNTTVAGSPVEALVKTIEVNLIGVVQTVKATLPALTESRGYYLLVSSASAIVAPPGLAAYAASKAGVEHFGDVLRLEVAHRGIDVGVVFPSWIDTDLVRDQMHDLPSFTEMLQGLPPPFNTVTPVETCGKAIVEAIADRKSAQYVPASVGPVAAARQVIAGPFEFLAKRRSRAGVPRAEAEARALGRPFGAHSVGLTLLERDKRH